MNMNNGVYTSLDIGTTSIKVVVSEVHSNQLKVIGVGKAKSKGLKRGMIVDIDATVQAIQSAIKQASDKSGVRINQLVVGVPANDVSIEPCHGVVTIDDRSAEITTEDVNRVVNQSVANIIPPERDLLSVTLEEFIVDGFDEIHDPRSMVGQRLEMYGTAVSVPKTILHNIRRCVEKAGFQIAALVLQPQAMAKVALSEDERNFGTVMIDLGGGQTTYSAIHDQQVKYASVVQEAGEFITKDISIVINTSQQNAEKLKHEVGAIQSDSSSTVQVDVVGQNEPVKIKESYVGEIIEARVSQIFEKVKNDLDQINAFELPGGAVISGGSASIPGIGDLAEDVFDVRSEIYIPDYMGIRTPTYTVAVGLNLHEAETSDIQEAINQSILRKMGINPANHTQNQVIDQAGGKPKSKSKKPQPQLQGQDAEPVVSEDPDSTKSSNQLSDKIKNFFSTFFE